MNALRLGVLLVYLQTRLRAAARPLAVALASAAILAACSNPFLANQSAGKPVDPRACADLVAKAYTNQSAAGVTGCLDPKLRLDYYQHNIHSDADLVAYAHTRYGWTLDAGCGAFNDPSFPDWLKGKDYAYTAHDQSGTPILLVVATKNGRVFQIAYKSNFSGACPPAA